MHQVSRDCGLVLNKIFGLIVVLDDEDTFRSHGVYDAVEHGGIFNFDEVDDGGVVALDSALADVKFLSGKFAGEDIMTND